MKWRQWWKWSRRPVCKGWHWQASPRARSERRENRSVAALFCAPNWGKTKFTRSNWLWSTSEANTYLQMRSATCSQRLPCAICYSSVEKQRSVLRYLVVLHRLIEGLRQGSPGLQLSMHTPAMSSGENPLATPEDDGSRASEFPTGKRHLHPQFLVYYTKCNRYTY